MIQFMRGNAGSGTPMEEVTLQETGITLPPALLPAAGALLVAAGIALIVWSDILVNLFIIILGILAIILGMGFIAGGHFMGRIGIFPVLLFIAGLLSIMIGILVFLRRDLVFHLIIYLGAVIAILAGLFLFFVGGLLSVHGWVRRVFFGGGAGLLLAGISLLLFPALVTRILITAGGAVIAGAGCLAILISLLQKAGIGHPV
jgi:hypothetical protein